MRLIELHQVADELSTRPLCKYALSVGTNILGIDPEVLDGDLDDEANTPVHLIKLTGEGISDTHAYIRMFASGDAFVADFKSDKGTLLMSDRYKKLETLPAGYFFQLVNGNHLCLGETFFLFCDLAYSKVQTQQASIVDLALTSSIDEYVCDTPKPNEVNDLPNCSHSPEMFADNDSYTVTNIKAKADNLEDSQDGEMGLLGTPELFSSYKTPVQTTDKTRQQLQSSEEDADPSNSTVLPTPGQRPQLSMSLSPHLTEKSSRSRHGSHEFTELDSSFRFHVDKDLFVPQDSFSAIPLTHEPVETTVIGGDEGGEDNWTLSPEIDGSLPSLKLPDEMSPLRQSEDGDSPTAVPTNISHDVLVDADSTVHLDITAVNPTALLLTSKLSRETDSPQNNVTGSLDISDKTISTHGNTQTQKPSNIKSSPARTLRSRTTQKEERIADTPDREANTTETYDEMQNANESKDTESIVNNVKQQRTPRGQKRKAKTSTPHKVVTQDESLILSSPKKRTRTKSPPPSPQSLKKSTSQNDSHTNNDGPRVMFTMLHGTEAKQYHKMVTTLGGSIVHQWKDCTHLVVDKVRRSVKFLCALSAGCDIVSIDWIEKSNKKHSFIDAAKYLIHDKEAERHYGFQLSKSLAKVRQTKPFAGLKFYVTSQCKPPKDEMLEIVEASGGSMIDATPSRQATSSDADKQGIVIIGTEDDMAEVIALEGLGYIVHSAEFLLTGILRQTLDWTSHRLTKEVQPERTNKRRR